MVFPPDAIDALPSLRAVSMSFRKSGYEAAAVRETINTVHVILILEVEKLILLILAQAGSSHRNRLPQMVNSFFAISRINGIFDDGFVSG
jgi:hypothetical protein